MTAEIIPIQHGHMRWAVPATLVGFSNDVPACIKAYYVLQCIEYPTMPAEEKAIYLLRNSGTFFSKLYGLWINQCEMLVGAEKLQQEIGLIAKARLHNLKSHKRRVVHNEHTSVTLYKMSPHLEEIWWEMNIGDKPRTIRSLFKEFEAELLRPA